MPVANKSKTSGSAAMAAWEKLAEKGPTILDEVGTYHTEVRACFNEMERCIGGNAIPNRTPLQARSTWARLTKSAPKLGGTQLHQFMERALAAFDRHLGRGRATPAGGTGGAAKNRGGGGNTS